MISPATLPHFFRPLPLALPGTVMDQQGPFDVLLNRPAAFFGIHSGPDILYRLVDTSAPWVAEA